jgi:hypothetical protein
MGKRRMFVIPLFRTFLKESLMTTIIARIFLTSIFSFRLSMRVVESAGDLRTWRVCSLAIIGWSSFALHQPAYATAIRIPAVNLASGVDRSTGQVLVNGAQDPNYALVAVPAGVDAGMVGLVGRRANALTQSNPAVAGSYLPDSTASRWISVINSVFQPNSIYLQQGNPYVFETTVSLNAAQAPTAQIDGLRTAVDNKLIGIKVNGSSVFTAPASFAEEFKSFKMFQDGVGHGLFHSGTNTIQFLIDNYVSAPSPAALRVEGAITALIPEPTTSALTILILGLVGALRRRRPHRLQ